MNDLLSMTLGPIASLKEAELKKKIEEAPIKLKTSGKILMYSGINSASKAKFDGDKTKMLFCQEA